MCVCPCCKYEYIEGSYKRVDIVEYYRTGPKKGQPKPNKKVSYEWVNLSEGLPFDQLYLVERMSLQQGTDLIPVNVCPECGVVFKPK